MVAPSAESKTGQRAPLSRRRIVEAAVGYIDTHGLDGFSMHKLGTELGVKAMSLYHHVNGKDDILDGVVELFWEEVENAAPAGPDWREGYRRLAHALREAIHRHAQSARLTLSQQTMPTAALRCIRSHITAATDNGIPEAHALALLRTITSYALGTALAEATWGTVQNGQCAPVAVEDLIPPGAPDELADIARVFCGQSDPDAEFSLGLDLMLDRS